MGKLPTFVLRAAWDLPHLFPDLNLGLGEVNQLAGIASLAVAVATGAVTVWAVLHPPNPHTPKAPAGGGAGNTITGAPSGTTVQAHTVEGGVGNTTHHSGGGDHIDFSDGTFHDKVVGKHEEHHHRPDTPDDTGR
ncbi:hypothetical protein KIK06_17615 [Nocardiopsis sp. EMB25]|uniref:hypothetical protein n=1 Tax=Nocardiopsis sp. EMB25 TaxID=2835867 RepID=UPI002283DAC3|nr:hypothetical protein [Nocardiopsis sp. EMB25]MCY9785707.1 hypothetical protein [Nocardiopsis sp. EMB25]